MSKAVKISTDKKTKDDKKVQSFLHEAQKAGRASGKMDIGDLDEAMATMTHILEKDVATAYKNKPEADWPTCQMAVYCHDCRDIVPGGEGRTNKGKPRLVCGKCESRKISKGREDALRRFYHIDKKKDEEKKSEEPLSPPAEDRLSSEKKTEKKK